MNQSIRLLGAKHAGWLIPWLTVRGDLLPLNHAGVGGERLVLLVGSLHPVSVL